MSDGPITKEEFLAEIENQIKYVDFLDNSFKAGYFTKVNDYANPQDLIAWLNVQTNLTDDQKLKMLMGFCAATNNNEYYASLVYDADVTAPSFITKYI